MTFTKKSVTGILLYCFLFISVAKGQNSQKTIQLSKIDSLIQTTDTISVSFDRMKKLVTYAGKMRYTKQSRKLIEKAIKISKESKNPELLANVYYSLGNWYYYNAELDSSMVTIDKAMGFVKKDEPSFILSSILATKGGIYQQKDKVSESIEYTIEAKKVLDKMDTINLSSEDKIKHKGQNSVLSNSLANLYSKMEDYETAIIYYDLSYNSLLALNDFGGAGIVLSNKAGLLLKMDKIDEALKDLNISIQHKIKGKVPQTSIAYSELNKGIALKKLARDSLAMQFFNDAYSKFNVNNHKEGLAEVLAERGLLYKEREMFDLAILDCERAKKLSEEIGVSEQKARACKCLYEAFKSIGEFENALTNFVTYSTVQDSLFTQKNIKNLTQIEMRYEFNKKEEEQLRILENQKRQKRNILIGLVTLAVFSIVIIAFLRKRLQYKNKLAAQKEILQKQKITDLQQKNKLLAMSSMIEGQEAERLRIAKDLHDSLGGLLSTVKAHFTTIQNEIKQLEELNITEKTNHLIDEACVEVRRISHNMMPHALSIAGLQGAIEDAGAHLNSQGYRTTVEIKNLPSNLSETREVMIYRLIQEIISNIRKHAEAKTILIQLIGHENLINLIIEDDGKGFMYDTALDKGGLGLKSINSRVQFLDGSIDWDTSPGNGTLVTITIPVK